MSDEQPGVGLTIGDDFVVVKEHRVEDNGRVLANYLPEFTYKVTPRNREIILKMVADGIARPAPARRKGATELLAGESRLRGAVKVGGRK